MPAPRHLPGPATSTGYSVYGIPDDPSYSSDSPTVLAYERYWRLPPGSVRLMQEFVDHGPGWWPSVRWRSALSNSMEFIHSPLLE